ncbi:MAG: hypothetical protein LC802_00310 [Acidobacteria bacterium]|nr:hypothetical protein [Acidobacteriota bacterium]
MFSRRFRRTTLPFLLLLLLCSHARADSGPELRGGEIKKAEDVMARLWRLEEAAGAPDGSRAFGALVRDFYPELQRKIEGLPEGDLRTDLLTAALLYETAAKATRRAGASMPVCGRELRDSYRKLCLENSSGDRAQFLRAKARLHARWAEAALRHLRGARDTATLDALNEMRASRDVDGVLGVRAIAALKTLAARARALTSDEDSERRTARVRFSFDQISDGFNEELATVDGVLASLPRGRVYDLLRNARNSYRDGLYWSGKTFQRRAPVLSANSFDATDELTKMRLDASTVDHTVLGNWLSADRFTKRAEKVLEEGARRSALRPSDTLGR